MLVMFYSLDKLKPKTKTNQLFFVGVNENSTTFLYTLNFFIRGKKVFLSFLFKVYKKVEMSATKKKFGF